MYALYLYPGFDVNLYWMIAIKGLHKYFQAVKCIDYYGYWTDFIVCYSINKRHPSNVFHYQGHYQHEIYDSHIVCK